jgi:hypothetical protein
MLFFPVFFVMANCPYCDDEMTGRCDCGAGACVCGYCPRCEAKADGTDDESDAPDAEDEGE